MRVHRRLPLVVLLVISSFQLFAQTVIRERVEIEPRTTMTEPLAPLFTTQSGGPFFVGPNGQTVHSTFPTLEIDKGTIATVIPMPPMGTEVAGLYIELATSTGQAFPLKRIYNCNGNTTEINFPVPTISLPNCGFFYVRYKVIRSANFFFCNPQDFSPTGTFLFASPLVDGLQAIFHIRDTVFNPFRAPIPVSADVEILAGAASGYEASRLTVNPFKNELVCVDSTTTTVNIFGLNNQLLNICPNGQIEVVALLGTLAPYVYLEKDTLIGTEGNSLTFYSPTASPTFKVVLDTSKGVIPYGYQEVVLNVEAGGVEIDTTIILRCDYPPPSVTITTPGQDTTIILTADNQPIIILQEEHTPTSGQFEAQVSWEPSGPSFNTADYYDQIEDSLVIPIIATATNVAQLTAKDTVWVTLKKNLLHHFAVMMQPNIIEYTESSVVHVQAKDTANADVTLADTTRLNAFIHTSDAQYGTLVAPGFSPGEPLIGVQYSAFQAGSVVFLADGVQPDSVQPVRIGVSLSEDVGINGEDTVFVRGGCDLQIPRYAQGGVSAWAEDHYDNAFNENGTPKKIKDEGCALSSLAMVMTAFGVPVDPGTLNTWKKGHSFNEGGYFGAKVAWGVVEKYVPERIKLENYVGKELPKLSAISEPSVLDEPLQNCKLVIVQVYNKDTRNQHWVVVTGKENGRYKIVDPGGRNETFLDAYGNFWSYAIIRKN